MMGWAGKVRRRAAAGQQYAIVVGLIAVAAILAVTVLGQNIKVLFGATANRLGGPGNATAESPAQTTPQQPASIVSCADQLAQAPGSPSGVYTLQIGGQGRDVWCDMTSHGGGWMVLRDSTTNGFSAAAFGTVSAAPGWSIGYGAGSVFGELPVTDFFVEVDGGPAGVFRQVTLLDSSARPTAAQIFAPGVSTEWYCTSASRSACSFQTHDGVDRDWGVWHMTSACCLGGGGMWYHSRLDGVNNLNYGICDGGYPNGTVSSMADTVHGCTAGQHTLTSPSGSKRFRIGIKYADGSGSATPAVNQAPAWQTAASIGSFALNASISATLTATDPDGDPITYSVVTSGLPSGVSLSGNTLSGSSAVAGSYGVTVRASDGRGKSVDRAFTFTIGQATSCAALLAANASLPSGLYTIRPDVAGTSSIQVYCDMTTAGGGWTILANTLVSGVHGGAQGTVSTGTGWSLNYNSGFLSTIPATALMIELPGLNRLVLDDIVVYSTTNRPTVASLIGGASTIDWYCMTHTGSACRVTARGASSTGGAGRHWGYWHFTTGCCGSGPGIWYYSQNSSNSNVLNYGFCTQLYPNGTLSSNNGNGGCQANQNTPITPTGNLYFRIGIRH